MLSFLAGEADVLVTTSIIESGIDIPTVNTLIVERADLLERRLGNTDEAFAILDRVARALPLLLLFALIGAPALAQTVLLIQRDRQAAIAASNQANRLSRLTSRRSSYRSQYSPRIRW